MAPDHGIGPALKDIFQGIAALQTRFPNRQFTIDGRLVGDIGEIIASIEYDLELDAVSQRSYDATTSDGRRVQVKATFQNALTFGTTPDYYLGLKLLPDGMYQEIFNGPGQIIRDAYATRKGIGERLLRFPNARLSILSAQVPKQDRIPKRAV